MLFDLEGRGPAPSRPATWREVADWIDEVDDDAPVHLLAEDFRAYLPGLLLGGLCYMTNPGNPVTESAVHDLFQNYYDSWWDQRFMDRWCHFTATQLDVIEAAVALLFAGPAPGSPAEAAMRSMLGPLSLERARQTLELIRLRAALDALEEPRADPGAG